MRRAPYTLAQKHLTPETAYLTSRREDEVGPEDTGSALSVVGSGFPKRGVFLRSWRDKKL